MPTNAGELDQRVDIKRLVETRDEYGAVIPNEGLVIATVWAAIDTDGGNEHLSANQVQADTSHTIKIRYSPDVADLTTKDWLVNLRDNRIFQIVAIANPTERREILILRCAQRDVEL